MFFIWEHGEESIKEFINEINSFHPTMKFTADWSKEKVNFLDVEVTLNNGVLSSDLFGKPTDTHQFLDPTSCHPYDCKKCIPYIAQYQGLIGFALIIIILINDVISRKVGC